MPPLIAYNIKDPNRKMGIATETIMQTKRTPEVFK